MKGQLDALKHLEAKFEQLKISLEESEQRRANADAEADRLRVQLNHVSGQSTSDVENLKRALDDLRFQNEDNINTINLRNHENADLNRELLEAKHALGEREAEGDELEAQMAEVERKNRLLNDKINEIIYNKAAVYKEKTLEVLKRNPEQVTPRGRRERAEQFGIPDESGERLNQALQNERVTTDKALGQIRGAMRQQSPGRHPLTAPKGVTNYAVVHNLERLEGQEHPAAPHEQRSDSPLRQSTLSGGNPFRHQYQRENMQHPYDHGELLGSGNHSMLKPVRSSLSGSAGRSPLRTRSHGRSSLSPGYDARSSIHQPQLGAHLEAPQYSTNLGAGMQHRPTSPLRTRGNPLAAHMAEQMLNHTGSDPARVTGPRRDSSYPPDEDSTATNQAAAIMTSVSTHAHLSRINSHPIDSEYDQAKPRLIEK